MYVGSFCLKLKLFFIFFMKTDCPFCLSQRIRKIECSSLVYGNCEVCGGFFLFSRYFPSSQKSRERYEHHNNELSDPGYRNYLQNFIDTFLDFFRTDAGLRSRPASILDWGSGPVPSLTTLLQEQGFEAYPYDLHYQPVLPDAAVRFEAIVCLEVAEHFLSPRDEFRRMADFLLPSGYLVVGTHPAESMSCDFEKWWYRSDITHVSFYSEKSLEIVGASADLVFRGKIGQFEYVFQKKG